MRTPAQASLRFQSLNIRAMPGFRVGEGFRLDDLDHDVIVVLGPNGSGKSTIMKSLLSLLWPSRPEAKVAFLDASARLGSAALSAKLDGGRIVWHDSANRIDPPLVGDVGRALHYRLALPDMLGDPGSDMVGSIKRALVGGFDLTPLQRGILDKPPVSRSSKTELEVATQELNQAEAKALNFKGADDQLTDLRRELDEIRAKLLNEAELRAEQKERQARGELKAARKALKALNPVLGKLASDEGQIFERLEQAVQSALGEVDAVERAVRDAHPQGQAEIIPSRLSTNDIRHLISDIDELTEAEGRRDRAESQGRQAEEALLLLQNQIAKEVGMPLSAIQMERLRTSTSASLVDGFRGLFANEARRDALDEALSRITGTDEPISEDKLRQGIDCLLAWLKVPEPLEDAPKSRLPQATVFFIAGAVCLVIGAALGLMKFALGGGLLLGLGLGLLLAGWVRSNTEREVQQPEDPRPGLQSKYEALGFSAPSWSDPIKISLEVDAMVNSRAAALLGKERLSLRDELSRERARIEVTVLQLKEEIEKRVDEGGLPTPTSSESLARVLAMADTLLIRMSEVASASCEKEALVTECNERLQSLSARLTSFGYAAPSGSRAARVCAEGLAEWSRQSERFEQAQMARDKARANLEERYRLIGLEPGDVASRQALIQERPRLDAAQSARRSALTTCLRARAERAKPRSFLGLTSEELQTRLAEFEALRGKMQDLGPEIGALEEKIRAAKGATEIETKLESFVRARASVAEDRTKAVSKMLFSVLAQHVVTESRDHLMPQVFLKAREIFDRVTQGRYELDIDLTTEPGEFRAFDRTQGERLPVNALSTGTKVQLLLAVRMAFVQFEESIALPLLLDETLATTDPERSAEVVAAIGELLVDGRQAFYFTTQPDEAAQWKEILGDRVRIVDLAATRRLTIREELWQPISAAETLVKRFPAPEGRDRIAYGQLLGVPPRVGDRHIGSVHLWHLIVDPEVLYRALVDSGRETWGAFSGLAERILEPEVLRRVIARVRATEAAIDAFRVGRGEPISEVELRAAKLHAASIDRILEIDPSLLDDAKRLYNFLGGKVDKVQSRIAERIRAFLEETGKFDKREPLGRDQIAEAVMEVTLDDRKAGYLAVSDVNEIVYSLPLPDGSLF